MSEHLATRRAFTDEAFLELMHNVIVFFAAAYHLCSLVFPKDQCKGAAPTMMQKRCDQRWQSVHICTNKSLCWLTMRIKQVHLSTNYFSANRCLPVNHSKSSSLCCCLLGRGRWEAPLGGGVDRTAGGGRCIHRKPTNQSHLTPRQINHL